MLLLVVLSTVLLVTLLVASVFVFIACRRGGKVCAGYAAAAMRGIPPIQHF